MKMFLLAVAKKLSYVFAICIILFAILISVTFLLTPFLDRYRPDLERWASDLLQMPVAISKVNVSWYHYQPEINLYTVTILNKTTKKPILQIQKIRVFFSVFESIWQRQFVPIGLGIVGADINLRE